MCEREWITTPLTLESLRAWSRHRNVLDELSKNTENDVNNAHHLYKSELQCNVVCFESKFL